MNETGSMLSRMLLAAGVAFGLGACAQQPNTPTVAGSGLVPLTGSAQGVNTHNSEPMPGGMRMQGTGVAPGTPFSADRSAVPGTGGAQGVNPMNSQPMPSGMRMGTGVSGTPMQSDPTMVPRTGSAQGVNPMDSQPMPSGMAMPNAPARY